MADLRSIFYPEVRFGGFADADGTIAFYLRVNSLISPSAVVLEVGCGTGRVCMEDPVPIRKSLRILKGKCRKVIGIDVDRAARENPFIDEFRAIEGLRWPVEDETIDLVLCDFVLEHVKDPDSFFSQCHRALKQGGHICIRTSNAISYVGLFSRLIPNRFHNHILPRIMRWRKEGDVYPTYHRCNTVWKIRKMLDKYGFDNLVYGFDAEPAYLQFSRILYFLGVIHQKVAPGALKAGIFAFGKKIRQEG